jgi:hypothetical protein
MIPLGDRYATEQNDRSLPVPRLRTVKRFRRIKSVSKIRAEALLNLTQAFTQAVGVVMKPWPAMISRRIGPLQMLFIGSDASAFNDFFKADTGTLILFSKSTAKTREYGSSTLNFEQRGLYQALAVSSPQ